MKCEALPGFNSRKRNNPKPAFKMRLHTILNSHVPVSPATGGKLGPNTSDSCTMVRSAPEGSTAPVEASEEPKKADSTGCLTSEQSPHENHPN